jgi:hypothetical protein
MNDLPQSFIAYTWGPFANNHNRIIARGYAAKKAVLPMITAVVIKQFGAGAMIFPAGRFPGRLLAQV